MKHARETRRLPHHLISVGGRIAIVLLLASSVVAAGSAVQARTRVVRSAEHNSFHGRAASYRQTNLVSDISGLAVTTDPNLVNPWGISHSSTSPFWISDNGTGVSTLYNGAGQQVPLTVTIPPPGSSPDTKATPTGQVFNMFNTIGDFSVMSSTASGSSVFIFVTEDGTISGWSRSVDRTHAILAVDNSASGAVYKGLALGNNGSGNFLYATNFHAGTIDVFDAQFHQVTLSGSFSDAGIPSGFAPFGIQNIGGQLFVTYAKQDVDKHDDVAGPGNGFVDVFDTNGNLIRRFASQGTLNSPWGLALAPDEFGRFSEDLLVGNFGDGRINAFDPETGAFRGQFRDTLGHTLVIDGLWGLIFGNGHSAGDTGTLFFTAGIDHEQHGLFGSLTPGKQREG
jgi:uncharacterized protein (TIGR03118 family)